MGIHDQGIVDVRNVSSGKDGQLFVTNKAGDNVFLAEVDTFSAKISPINVDYQPVGSSLKYSVNTGYTFSLSFTEVVVRDDIMVSELLEELLSGYFPVWEFQGKLQRRDGQSQRAVYRNCVPEGEIDIQSFVPGELVKRNWSFRVNAEPELIGMLTS